MLLTSLARRQLWIFAVLATTALGVTFLGYAKTPAMVGIGVYDVHVEFADASGLYPKAQVTYRGVKVGKVEELKVGDRGAVATLRIGNDADIPADAVAELHSTSAIGEQYVDLVADDGAGPFLSDGDVIPRARAVEMPQISPVLDSVNRLVASVPREETRRLLSGVDDGLGGADRDLGGILESSDALLAEAQANIDATSSLIASLRPVLDTQRRLAPATRSYASALRDLTAALAAEDSADLRALLRSGPGGLDELTRTARDLQPTLPLLVANLTTNAEVLHTYLPHLRQTLVVYPATVARLQSAVNPRADHGDVQLDLRTTFGDPPSCQSGYLPRGQRRSPSNSSTRDVDRLAHCKIPREHPTAVRGARNRPCPDSTRRGALPSSCGLTFGRGRWPATSGTVAYDLVAGRGDQQSLDLDPSGEAAAHEPDGIEGDELWKLLVLAPLAAR